MEDNKYNDDKTILSALTIKNINSKIKIIADLINKDKISYLKRANVDTIIMKDEFENNMINAQILHPGIPETINTLMTSDKKNHLKFIRNDNLVVRIYVSSSKHIQNKQNITLKRYDCDH